MPNIKSSNSPNSDTANLRSDMRSKIINYIRAGYAGLFLVSPEEQRVEVQMKNIAKEVGFKLYAWSTTTGLVDTDKGAACQANDPMEALLAIQELSEKTIVLLRDFHLFLSGDPNPVLLRQLKDTLQHAKILNKPLVILGCRLCLPPELERELTVLEFALPGKEQLGRVLDGIIESAQLPAMVEQQRETVLDAAGGLTTMEAENAFALSVVEAKGIVPAVIAREKAHAIKKNGLLEIIETRTGY